MAVEIEARIARLEELRREAHFAELKQRLLEELDTEEKLQEVIGVLAMRHDL